MKSVSTWEVFKEFCRLKWEEFKVIVEENVLGTLFLFSAILLWLLIHLIEFLEKYNLFNIFWMTLFGLMSITVIFWFGSNWRQAKINVRR